MVKMETKKKTNKMAKFWAFIVSAIKRFGTTFQGSSGKEWSSKRVVYVASAFAAIFTINYVWGYLSIKNNKVMEIPETVLLFYALAVIGDGAIKVWQSIIEMRSNRITTVKTDPTDPTKTVTEVKPVVEAPSGS